MRYFKVNITETVTRHVWIKADDPFDAVDKAEQRYSCPNGAEPLNVEFDVDVTAERPQTNRFKEDYEDG